MACHRLWWISLWLFCTAWTLAERQHRNDGNQVDEFAAVDALLKAYQALLAAASSSDSVIRSGPPVYIGSSPPDVPDEEPTSMTANWTVEVSKRKDGHHHHHPKQPHDLQTLRPLRLPTSRLVKTRHEPLSQESCKTIRSWKQINETYDIYGSEVRIIHTEQYRQFAFVYECTNEGGVCSGVSDYLRSVCETRSGWANMLHIRLSDIGSEVLPQWGYVRVPHHCACRIYPRINPFGPK